MDKNKEYLYEKIQEFLKVSRPDKLKDLPNIKDIHIVAQTAPSIRTSLGEGFGFAIGSDVTKKMVSAFKLSGFDSIFETDFGADMTIMEEATEFLDRLKNDGTLPMITSCCPAWINFAEKFYPNLLRHLSSTKSPMEILGVLIKKYYSKINNIKEENIYSIAIMPCLAKKSEIIRQQLYLDSKQVIDQVITTREIIQMLKDVNIDITKLEDTEFDNPLSNASGGGHIFGKTGGVMNSALRTVYEMTNGIDNIDIEYVQTQDNEQIKEAKISLLGKDIWIAVVNGLNGAKKMMDDIQSGKNKYTFIEVTSCIGGCIMGPGQPIIDSNIMSKEEVRQKRASVLANVDKNTKFKSAYKSENAKLIYREFVKDKPNSQKAKELFHTKYVK